MSINLNSTKPDCVFHADEQCHGNSNILQHGINATNCGNFCLKVSELTKPRRPLSGYNFFFQYERAKLLGQSPSFPHFANTSASKEKRSHRKTHGKIGFKELAKHIGRAWKNIDDCKRSLFQAEAKKDQARYREEMKEYLNKKSSEEETIASLFKSLSSFQGCENANRKNSFSEFHSELALSRKQIASMASRNSPKQNENTSVLIPNMSKKTLNVLLCNERFREILPHAEQQSIDVAKFEKSKRCQGEIDSRFGRDTLNHNILVGISSDALNYATWNKHTQMGQKQNLLPSKLVSKTKHQDHGTENQNVTVKKAARNSLEESIEMLGRSTSIVQSGSLLSSELSSMCANTSSRYGIHTSVLNEFTNVSTRYEEGVLSNERNNAISNSSTFTIANQGSSLETIGQFDPMDDLREVLGDDMIECMKHLNYDSCGND